MASSVIKVAIAVVAMVVMVLASSPREVSGNMNCGQVASYMIPCLGYLRSGGPLGQCCSGIQGLVNAASTTPDRQTACSCLKAAAINSGVDANKAKALPSLCHVSIGYPISMDVDCSKVK